MLTPSLFRILFVINSLISLSLVSKTGIAFCAIHPRDCSTAGRCVFSSSISTSFCVDMTKIIVKGKKKEYV